MLEKLKNSKKFYALQLSWTILVLIFSILFFAQQLQLVARYFAYVHWLRLLISIILILFGKLLLHMGKHLAQLIEGEKQPIGEYLSTAVSLKVKPFLRQPVKSPSPLLHQANKVDAFWALLSAFTTGAIFFITFNRGILVQYGVKISRTQSQLIVLGILLLWVIGLVIVQRYIQSLEHLDARLILKVSAIYIPAWVVFGISYGLLFPEMDAAGLGLSIGGFALSWSIGYLAVFAPGGIGIRELALTFVFSGTAYAALSPVLATVHRVLWVMAELLLGLIVVVADAIRKKSEKSEDLVEESSIEV